MNWKVYVTYHGIIWCTNLTSAGKTKKNYTSHSVSVGHNFCPGNVKVKIKIKFILEQAMKVQRRSRGIALLFL